VLNTWTAVLTLYLFAPLIAEMLSGSTPPLMWNNVGGIIMTTGLYGSGALLARELIRRRGLGWSNLALLGAAYGVLEEGLAFQSWFNPTWANPPDAARFLGVNWTLALIFTTIHVALSVMSSVVVAEALFPQQANRPWLGRKGLVGFTLWLFVITVWLFVSYGFLLYRSKGYGHPPVSYGVAIVLFALFLWLGLRRRKASTSSGTRLHDMLRPAPRLWALRLAGFDPIDPLINGAQPYTSSQCGTPALAQVTQTLAQTTAEEHVLIQIQPEALIFLPDRKVSHDIMLAALAFQHRHLHVIQMSPSRFQAAAIMSVASKLIGIGATAMSAVPVDLTWLQADLACRTLFTPQFGRDFLFQKRLQYRPHGRFGCCLCLALHLLQDCFAFLSF